jgi:threonine dehydrogenase-like Zn-dependent dehydrogenase
MQDTLWRKIYGAGVSTEAVGLPDTFSICQHLARPGSQVANIGMQVIV